MFFLKSTLFFSEPPRLCSILEKKVCRNPRRIALSGSVLVKIEQKTAQNPNFRIFSALKNGSFCKYNSGVGHISVETPFSAIKQHSIKCYFKKYHCCENCIFSCSFILKFSKMQFCWKWPILDLIFSCGLLYVRK